MCNNSFGQNSSTSSTQYAHDIQGEISACSCDPVRVYTTLVRVLRYVYENHMTFLRHFYEFSRVCKSSTRSLASLYDVYSDILRYVTTFTRDLYDDVRVSLDFPRHRTTSHDIYTTSCGFENKNSDSWSLSHLFSREKQLI